MCDNSEAKHYNTVSYKLSILFLCSSIAKFPLGEPVKSDSEKTPATVPVPLDVYFDNLNDLRL